MRYSEKEKLIAEEKILKSYNSGNMVLGSIRKDTGYSYDYIRKVLSNNNLKPIPGWHNTELTQRILKIIKKDEKATCAEIARKANTTRQNVRRVKNKFLNK